MISFVITTGSLNSQDMIRILKQWRHDFSGKHLCIRYCMDIMWRLSGGQNSWFCKASFWICYVSLFECKNFIKCHVWIEDYKTRLKKYHVQFKYHVSTISILLFLMFSLPSILFLYIINIGYWQVLFIT